MRNRLANRPSILTVEIAIIAAAILFFVVMVGLQLDKRLQFDEVEWPPQAVGILLHGVPVIYFGEDAFVRRYPYEMMGEAAHWGIWHPPLYLYLMATVFAFLGSSTAAARFVGVLAGLATVVLAVLLAKQLSSKSLFEVRQGVAVKAVVALAVVLTLTSPFFVQGILYLDIDNTILTPLVLFFLYLTQRFEIFEPLTPRRMFFLSAVFALTLWAKITTPMLVLGALGASYLLRRRWAAMINVALIGIIGSIIFGLTWLAYSYLAHVPADFPFRFTFLQRAGQITGATAGVSRPNALGHLFFYLTPPFAVLIGIVGIWALSLFRKRTQFSERAWTLGVSLIAVGAGYTLWIPTMSAKYKLPMIPLGAVLGAYLIVERLKKYGRQILMPAAALGVLCLVYYAILVPDLYYVPSTVGRLNGDILQRSLSDPRLAAWALSPLPLLAGPLFFRFRTNMKGWLDRILLTVLVVALALGVVQNVRSAVTDYSPLSFSVQPKFNEAVATMGELCGDEIVFAPKDIGYHLYQRCSVIPMDETEIFFFRDDADMLGVLEDRTDIRWAIDSLNYPSLREFPKSQAYISSEFDQVQVVGDFAIFRRKGEAGRR